MFANVKKFDTMEVVRDWIVSGGPGGFVVDLYSIYDA